MSTRFFTVLLALSTLVLPATAQDAEPATGQQPALTSSQLAAAGAPNRIAYQGYLDLSGTPVNGTVNLAFALYAVPTGGSALWSETQNGVSVNGGVYAVELGAITPLTSTLFDEELWLGVRVDGASELTPRTALLAAPYALGLRLPLRAEGVSVSGGDALLTLIDSGEDVVVEIEAGSNGMFINGASDDGLIVQDSGENGIRVETSNERALRIGSTGDEGILIESPSRSGVRVQKAGTPSSQNASFLPNGFSVDGAEANGLYVGRADGSGVFVRESAGPGVQVGQSGGPALLVTQTSGFGVFVASSGSVGLAVGSSASDGVQVNRAGSPSTTSSSSLVNGVEVGGAEGYGVFVGQADVDGMHVVSAVADGLHIGQVGSDGVNVQNAFLNGVAVRGSGSDGVFVNRAGGNGFRVSTAGTPSKIIGNTRRNGLQVDGAQGSGVHVGRADITGYVIDEAGFDGLFVGRAGSDGIRVVSAGRYGAHIQNTPSTDLGDQTTAYVGLFENTGTSSSADGLAIKIGTTGDPGAAANLMGFFDGDGDLIGQIEGNGSGGVQYNTTGADYAEYLPIAGCSSSACGLEAGTVVGVKAGEISLDTKDADEVLVVSTQPAVVGNAPRGESTDGFAAIAMLGQADVRVVGSVDAGDYVLASGRGDGTAVAVPASEIRVDMLERLIGRAWSTKPGAGEGTVNVAVGLDRTEVLSGIIRRQQRALEEQRREIDDLRQMIEALAAR